MLALKCEIDKSHHGYDATYRAPLNDRVFYSECATLYKCLNK